MLRSGSVAPGEGCQANTKGEHEFDVLHRGIFYRFKLVIHRNSS
jgi:hypothetical protein